MKVRVILFVLFIIIPLSVPNVFAFSPDKDGNWNGSYKTTVFFDGDSSQEELEMYTLFIARMKAAGDVAAHFSGEWDISPEELKPVFFFLLDSGMPESVFDKSEGRIVSDVKVSLPNEVINIHRLNIRFDMWYRYAHILPGKRMAEIETRLNESVSAQGRLMAAEVSKYSRSIYCTYLYLSAVSALRAGDFDAAKSNCLLATEQMETFYEAYYLYSISCQYSSDYIEAEKFQEKFLGYAPESIPGLLNQAINAGMQNNGQQQAYLDKVRSMQKDNEISVVLTANIFNMFGLTNYAVECYEQAAEKYPSNYVPHMMLGQFWLQYGDYYSALELFEEAYYQGGPEVPEAWDLLDIIDLLYEELY